MSLFDGVHSLNFRLLHVNSMKYQDGVTLIETLVVVLLGAIIATIGVPNLRTFILNNRRTTIMNELVTDLNLARVEAIKRGAQAVVCVGSESAGCTANPANWNDGWITFVDNNLTLAYESGNDVLLRQHGAVPDGFTLVYNSGVTNPNRVIAFNARGFGSLQRSGSFFLRDPRGSADSICRSINSIGRIRPGKVNTSDANSCDPI